MRMFDHYGSDPMGRPVVVPREEKPANGGGLKFDGGKPRTGLLPWGPLEQVAWVLTYGAEKYEPQSWQAVPNGAERYWDALCRHVTAHGRGEIIDPETGLPHMAQIATNALFILHFLAEKGAIPASYDFREVRKKFEAQREAVKKIRAKDLDDGYGK